MTPASPTSRRWIAVAALAAGLFCAVAVVIPIAELDGIPGASLGRLAFKQGCHQIPDRCLDLGAGPLPVCARCSGLYLGGFAALVVTAVGGRRFRPGWKILGAAVLPSAVDFGLGLVNLPDLANWPRLIVAIPPGFLFGLLVADALCSIVDANTGRSRTGPIT